jgi:hypothetical protein
MRAHSYILTLCLCLLSALAVTPCVAQEPAPKAAELKGTVVKIPQQTLSFSGHIQKLNALLPIPWFGLEISKALTPLTWSFSGTYWEGVTEICEKYQCAVSFFNNILQFETKGSFASLIHQGPFLFVIAEAPSKARFLMLAEPHMSIVSANVTRMTIGWTEVDFKMNAFTLEGAHGTIGLGWDIVAFRKMTGSPAVELEADIATSMTTLTVDAVEGATAREGDITITVTKVTDNSIQIDWDEGIWLSTFPTDPILESLGNGSWHSSRSYSAHYKIDHWEPGTQFVVTFAKEIKTQKFSLEFNDVNFRDLVPERK